MEWKIPLASTWMLNQEGQVPRRAGYLWFVRKPTLICTPQASTKGLSEWAYGVLTSILCAPCWPSLPVPLPIRADKRVKCTPVSLLICPRGGAVHLFCSVSKINAASRSQDITVPKTWACSLCSHQFIVARALTVSHPGKIYQTNFRRWAGQEPLPPAHCWGWAPKRTQYLRILDVLG